MRSRGVGRSLAGFCAIIGRFCRARLGKELRALPVEAALPFVDSGAAWAASHAGKVRIEPMTPPKGSTGPVEPCTARGASVPGIPGPRIHSLVLPVEELTPPTRRPWNSPDRSAKAGIFISSACRVTDYWSSAIGAAGLAWSDVPRVRQPW